MKLAILAAGKPFYSDHPLASERVFADVPAASWTMSVVGADTMSAQIVVGYSHEDVQQAIPGALLRLNPDWKASGSVGSFFCLDFDCLESILVTYSDVVFSRQIVENLVKEDADVVVAWDSQFLSKYNDSTRVFEKVFVDGKSVVKSGVSAENFPNAGFFLGVVKFSPRGLEKIQEIPQRERDLLSKSHMSELIDYLVDNGMTVGAVDCNGQWARVEEPDELARFILGSKADTLMRLSPLVSKSVVPPSFVFEAGEWVTGKSGILQSIENTWPGEELVIRSSARAEDTFEESMAGAFLSVIGVSGRASAEGAIEQVLSSYPDSNSDNQVLVQPKVQNLIANGVVFTRALGSDAPWLAVNFEVADRSDGVTSGLTSSARTLNLFRSPKDWLARAKSTIVMENLPSWITNLLEAVIELEHLIHYSRLDIEFGIDVNGRVHIFQVRPLAFSTNLVGPSDAEVEKELEKARLAWNVSDQGNKGRANENSIIFSNMTDWNPAEILGAAPRQLAISLYEELITNRVWSESRAYFGYRRVLNRPLLREVAGRPYVDVSASIESLLPSALDDEDCRSLLAFFLKWLKSHPDLHDKVEFDVLPTCLTPKFGDWAERISKFGGFSPALIAEYRNSLKNITHHALSSIDDDFDRLTMLDEAFLGAKNDTRMSRGEKIQQVLAVCKLYGTLPFSNLARRAFIAVALLKDAAHAGVISSTAVEGFLGTIRTVSHSFGEDASAVRSGSTSWDTFVSTYGHLRPGTYDITSPRYDSATDKFLLPVVESQLGNVGEKANGSNWVAERRHFFRWVRGELGEFEDDQIEGFLRKAIEGRETAKFTFTQLVSWVLEEVKIIANDWGLSVEDISYMRIEQILEVTIGALPDAMKSQELSKIVDENRGAHALSSFVKLPGFLADSDDLFVFVTGNDVPNFVGSKAIIKKRTHIWSGVNIGPEELNGTIVFIEAADPGFDWIFGSGIAGLVTKYGGANSHMAIRAAEFSLPAAIGVGETLFETLVKKDTIELDPTNQILRGL